MLSNDSTQSPRLSLLPATGRRRPGISPGRSRRALDLAVSLSALLLLAPVLVLVAVAIRCTSPGSVLFRQVRVGQGNVPFVIYKFRTMRPGAGGPEVTVAGDQRITRVGHFLRATGLDELPQLLNILRGDMTLVGPRPETPALARRYPRECRVVFQYRPALTGPSQIRLRDKDVLSSRRAGDTEERYLQQLVPVRTVLDIGYLADPSLRRTVGYLVETAAYLLRPLRRALSSRWARLTGRRGAPLPAEALVVDLAERARLLDLRYQTLDRPQVIELRDQAREWGR
jgi:lipopolysaccharide/colanic/teichoic acid biosynthesis glycosyltransferase